jgi:GNAT superfamily N-acetyltransferase
VDYQTGVELQHRNLSAWVRLLGASSEGSQLFERDGVLGAIVPACPERSVMNSVTYRDAAALGAALDDLAAAHDAAGVRAWTVWVPERDREAVSILAAAGHVLDATPVAMTLDLADLPDLDADDLDWDDRVTPAEVGRINDLAYGYEVGTFGVALAKVPTEPLLRRYQARLDGEAACVVGTMDAGDDCGVYFVATLKEARGRGLAPRLMRVALLEARERGCRTSTLQATKLGRPVYERLGYQTICALEMWERRKP